MNAGGSRRLIFHFASPSLQSDSPSYPWSYRNPAMVLCCCHGPWLHLLRIRWTATVEQALEIAGFSLWDQSWESMCLKRWVKHFTKTWFYCGASPAESSIRRWTTSPGSISRDFLHYLKWWHTESALWFYFRLKGYFCIRIYGNAVQC